MNVPSGSCTWQRREIKYLISETQAAEIRRCCLRYLSPDRYAMPRPGHEYPVASIYLDSPARALLLQTVHRSEQRTKLRVRSYRAVRETDSEAPAFFEVKRKVSGVVRKMRARLNAEVAASVLKSRDALFNGPNGHGSTSEANLNTFLHLRRRIGAEPAVGVFYTRQAYEGPSADRVRVTFDRGLHFGVLSKAVGGLPETWWPVRTDGVILEVKFTNTYPFWLADLLRRVEVVRRGVCKYVLCARAAGTLNGPGLGYGAI